MARRYSAKIQRKAMKTIINVLTSESSKDDNIVKVGELFLETLSKINEELTDDILVDFAIAEICKNMLKNNFPEKCPDGYDFNYHGVKSISVTRSHVGEHVVSAHDCVTLRILEEGYDLPIRLDGSNKNLEFKF